MYCVKCKATLLTDARFCIVCGIAVTNTAQTTTNSTENPFPVSIHGGTEVDEDAIYAAIAEELKSGNTDQGLWTRLFAECDGDENKSKVAYIKKRAEKLIALEQSRLAEIKSQRDEEAARFEKIRVEGLAISEQLSSGSLSDDLREKLKLLSISHTAAVFIGKVRTNLLSDVEAMLNDNPLLVAVTNSEGDSPLHLAIKENSLEMSVLLLGRGAPANIINRWGYTPLDVARAKANMSIVALLDCCRPSAE